MEMNEELANSLSRIIRIYEKLRHDGELDPDRAAVLYNKHRETIKKDIRYIREALDTDQGDIVYDRMNKVYKWKKNDSLLVRCYMIR